MTQKRILTIDDSKTMLELLEAALTSAGFQVTGAENGQDGLDCLRSGEFDAVITDINMPVMDGYTFIENVRADRGYAGLPILVLTTESSTEKKKRAKDAGGTGWIVKPFDPAKLVNVLNRVCH